jgi:UDP-N-acetyl-D-galactosamine dehydrogenase
VVKLLIKKENKVNTSKTLILGVTFKENCPDIRNSKVIDIYNELLQYGINVEVYDPHADKNEVEEEYNIKLVESIGNNYDAIILAVSHKEFLNIDFKNIIKGINSVIFDTKSFLNRDLVDARL